jgi:hypothetical protein
VTLMGRRVQIRPTSNGFTDVFGDGSSPLQTDSPGGTYPDSDITHAYAKSRRVLRQDRHHLWRRVQR